MKIKILVVSLAGGFFLVLAGFSSVSPGFALLTVPFLLYPWENLIDVE